MRANKLETALSGITYIACLVPPDMVLFHVYVQHITLVGLSFLLCSKHVIVHVHTRVKEVRRLVRVAMFSLHPVQRALMSLNAD